MIAVDASVGRTTPGRHSWVLVTLISWYEIVLELMKTFDILAMQYCKLDVFTVV